MHPVAVRYLRAWQLPKIVLIEFERNRVPHSFDFMLELVPFELGSNVVANLF